LDLKLGAREKEEGGINGEERIRESALYLYRLEASISLSSCNCNVGGLMRQKRDCEI
jgi:hypothetical protein